MDSPNLALLRSLQGVPWNVAARIFGNNHASLIGLFTHWWVSLSPQTRWVLESGPSYGYHTKGIGGGMCDALLYDGEEALGVLEVEGTRGKYTAEKMGQFFNAEIEYYQSLSFGILVLYAYSPRGKGQERAYPQAQDEETIKQVIHVSSNYPNKAIIVVTMDKSYNRRNTGVRSRNEYYWGELSKVMGVLYEQGREVASLLLYDENNVG
jgi:hypothetical protein